MLLLILCVEGVGTFGTRWCLSSFSKMYSVTVFKIISLGNSTPKFCQSLFRVCFVVDSLMLHHFFLTSKRLPRALFSELNLTQDTSLRLKN